MEFEFERLDAYRRAVAWVATVHGLTGRLRGRAPAPIGNQLVRAALSIPLNIAESSGRWHKADKKQFLRIARGSTFECVPILQVLYECKLLNESEHEAYRARLSEIGKMINGLLRSVDRLS